MEMIKIVWYPNPIDSTPDRLAKEYNVTCVNLGDDYYEITGGASDVDMFLECADVLDLVDIV